MTSLHRPKLLALSCALLCALAAQPATAYWAWLADTVASNFKESDWELLKSTAREAFATGADGERFDWSNPATGNSGAVKPVLTFSHDGRHCRNLAFLNISAAGGRGTASYALCESPDGLQYLSPYDMHR